MNQYKFDINDFELIKELNRGSFGKVYLVKNKQTKMLLAAKVIDAQKEITQREKLSINREIEIMIRIQNPAMIKFWGFSLCDFENANKVTLFMEYAKNGSLFDMCFKKKNTQNTDYDDTARQIILVGIAYGMMILHQNRGIHRDLKPANVLLDDQLHPHITDFGCSKIFDIGHSGEQSLKCGTPYYLAPEVMLGYYDQKVDIYSFGILMYEVVTQCHCYTKQQKFKLEKVLTGNLRPEFTKPIKPSLKALMERCWSGDPDERPSFDVLFKMLAFNIEDEFEIDIFSDKKKKEIESNADPNKYYLENVDQVRLLSYVNSITENNSSVSVPELTHKIIEMQQENERLIKKMKQQENNEGDTYLKEENIKLKDENLKLKDENLKLKDENIKLKDENLKLKDQNIKLTEESNVMGEENKKLKEKNAELYLNNQNVLNDNRRLKNLLAKTHRKKSIESKSRARTPPSIRDKSPPNVTPHQILSPQNQDPYDVNRKTRIKARSNLRDPKPLIDEKVKNQDVDGVNPPIKKKILNDVKPKTSDLPRYHQNQKKKRSNFKL